MRLNTFSINIGRSLLPKSEDGSVLDMIHRIREQHGTFNKIIMRISSESEICADCGFQFEVKGKTRFYPLHVLNNERIVGFSNLAIGAKAFGLSLDPVQLNNLGVGQFHITRDGIKKTK